MRRQLITAGALIALGAALGAAAVATAAPDFVLRGGRFRPLSYAELNPAQKALADAEIASGRKSFDGPTNIYLRSPEMANASRPLGRHLRFEPMQHKLKEIAILLTARFWGGQYVWYCTASSRSRPASRPPSSTTPWRPGKRPAISMPATALRCSTSHLRARWATRQVSDATYKTFVDRLGERGVSLAVQATPHPDRGALRHATTALFAVDRYPLPDGSCQIG